MNQRDLLDVWERAAPLDPTGRAVALLAAVGADPDAVAALPVGARDAGLLDLYAALFGPRLDAVVACPACGEQLELAFAVDQVRGGPPRAVEVRRFGGYDVNVRLPDSRDLMAVAGLEAAAAEAELLRRCVTADGAEVSDLPLEAIEEAMLAADPQAEIQIALTCEPCGHRWRATFDVGVFLWARLAASVRRCAVEVHTLARAYGWQEADILAMSPWRRSLYLELVSS